MLYDSVPEVLSELIRTAFVAMDGHKFVVNSGAPSIKKLNVTITIDTTRIVEIMREGVKNLVSIGNEFL